MYHNILAQFSYDEQQQQQEEEGEEAKEGENTSSICGNGNSGSNGRGSLLDKYIEEEKKKREMRTGEGGIINKKFVMLREVS